MSFIETFFHHLAERSDEAWVIEVRGDALKPATGAELASKVARARGALRTAGLKPGDRGVLLAPNSIEWVACDLALLGEGAVVVPMYARQDPDELVAMMHDCAPSVVVCADESLASAIRERWSDAPVRTFDEVFAGDPVEEPPVARGADDPVTIVYTSGTSGEPKGVVTTRENVDFMLPVTARSLEAMMGPRDEPHRVFHYLPFCFAGSRIVLWTCLFRRNPIHVSTDLEDLARELQTAAPHYLLNVPMLLERIKNGVDKQIRGQGRAVGALYDRARAAWAKPQRGLRDRAVLALAQRVLFSRIRAKIGVNLECLICGSAPLGEETQGWFQMLGIPVYQVYGLTETTAIVTMDRPPVVTPGRVGAALDGVEVRLGDDDELLVRGPNVFGGYWGRPEATEQAFVDGWFRTGDRAEVDATGNWRIVGRVKNLLVPTSGHNVAPEPIEQRLVEGIEGVEQAVLIGHGRPWLGALISGEADPRAVEAGIAAINESLPHYRRIRRWHLCEEPFTVENGLLTANRKLRRAAIEQAYAEIIDALYDARAAS